MLDQQNKPQEALLHYYAALAAPGLQAVDYYDLGTLLQKHGKHEDAVHCYRAAISATDFAEILSGAYNNLGMAEVRLSNDAQAERDFRSALKINPEMAEPYVGLANVALRSEDFSRAAELAEHSIELSPTAWGYVRLAEAYEKQGRDEEAIAAYRSALAIAPDLDEARSGISSLTQKH
jgi:tetratricopeptide (TPR) repeat protein